MTSVEQVAAGLLGAVPFARTLGLEIDEATAGRAVLRLPDEGAHHNHVGAPHAWALFTLGESASGAIVLGSFAGLLDRATPLVVRAEIAYKKLARGVVEAEARLGRPAGEVVAELDAGERPEFPVHISIHNQDGVTTAEMTVIWTLKPH